jgi:hypothetical protein
MDCRRDAVIPRVAIAQLLACVATSIQVVNTGAKT